MFGNSLLEYILEGAVLLLSRLLGVPLLSTRTNNLIKVGHPLSLDSLFLVGF